MLSSSIEGLIMNKGTFEVPVTRKRRQWKHEDLAKAVAAVRSGKMGYLKAAKEFNVPRGTVERHAKMEESKSNAMLLRKLGRQPIFSDSQEKKLVQYILTIESKFYGLTKRDVQRMAYQFAKANNVPNPFQKEAAGKAWFHSFMNRHKNVLSMRKPTGTSFATGFTRKNVDIFYDNLDNAYEKHKFTPDRIVNVDETGITVDQSKTPKVILLKGKDSGNRQVGTLTASEREKLITVVIAMSAAGVYIPPMIIFPRKSMDERLMRGAPPGAIGVVHPSGWIQTNLFTQWFKHFLEIMKPCAESPVLLILNDHNTHTRNIDVIDLALKHHVIMLTIPPCSSDKLQPLDKTFMGAFKTYYSEEIRMWMRNNTRPLSAFDVAELFNNAYVLVQTTALIAINGFRKTGICPYNRTLFTDADFIESENAARETRIQIVSIRRETEEGPVETEFQAQATENDPERAENVDKENESSPSLPPSIPGPSTSASQETSRFVRCIPEEFLLEPKIILKVGTRGRKRTKSSIVSTIEYREQLAVDAENEKQIQATPPAKRGHERKTSATQVETTPAPRHGRGRPRSSSSAKKLQVSDLSDTEQSDDESRKQPELNFEFCLICDAWFELLEDEPWVQCIECSCWAHTGCSGDIGYKWICDYCK